MHASASWRKRHPHAAVREVENSGSHVPAESAVRCYLEALCQLFNTLLDGDAGQDGLRANCGWRPLFSPHCGSTALGARKVTAAVAP